MTIMIRPLGWIMLECSKVKKWTFAAMMPLCCLLKQYNIANHNYYTVFLFPSLFFSLGRAALLQITDKSLRDENFLDFVWKWLYFFPTLNLYFVIVYNLCTDEWDTAPKCSVLKPKNIWYPPQFLGTRIQDCLSRVGLAWHSSWDCSQAIGYSLSLSRFDCS